MRRPDNTSKFKPALPARDIRDSIAIVRQLRDCLKKIADFEFVKADREAQRILWRMARSREMPAVNEQMDRLVVRVGELLSAKTGDPTVLTRLVASVRRNDPKAHVRLGKQHALSSEEQDQRQRVFVRL